MANNITGMPFIFTTTMSSTYRASSPVNKLSIYPTAIFWETPANIGDQFVFEAADGSVLWSGTCEVASQSQYFIIPSGDRWLDFQLTTMGSGTLYLYYKT